MDNISAFGTVTTLGILNLHNRKRLQQDLRQFSGKSVVITIKEKNVRTTLQNSYYWSGVVQEVRLGLLNMGYRMNNDEVHHFLKQKFNSITVANKEGLAMEIPKSTTELNKTEFSEYIERIAHFAAEYLGVEIKSPNSELALNF